MSRNFCAIRQEKMTAVILSGGNNSRILADKGFLRVGKKTIVEREIAVLSMIFSPIIIVTNSPERYRNFPVELSSDLIPEKGPLGGVYSGLAASRDEYNFVVGCDLPFLNPALITYMKNSAPGYDLVVPEVNGLLEPLYAFYSRNCLPAIRVSLEQNELSIRSFFSKVKLRYVRKTEIDNFDPRGITFFNVNTREDLKQAREIAVKLESRDK